MHTHTHLTRQISHVTVSIRHTVVHIHIHVHVHAHVHVHTHVHVATITSWWVSAHVHPVPNLKGSLKCYYICVYECMQFPNAHMCKYYDEAPMSAYF